MWVLPYKLLLSTFMYVQYPSIVLCSTSIFVWFLPLFTFLCFMDVDVRIGFRFGLDILRIDWTLVFMDQVQIGNDVWNPWKYHIFMVILMHIVYLLLVRFLCLLIESNVCFIISHTISISVILSYDDLTSFYYLPIFTPK